MATVRVRGIGLPFAEPVDLCAVDGVWVAEHDSSYDVIVEGWLTPGLADVHTHPGAADGEPFDEKVLRDDMREHAAAGVTLIRAPGLAGDPPSWFGSDPDLP